MMVHAGRKATIATPTRCVWRTEREFADWVTIRWQESGPFLTVSNLDETRVVLRDQVQVRRQHWKIIPYPEHSSSVIISRVTGFALTAGSSAEVLQWPVALAAYHGGTTQHWSLAN